MRLFPEVSWAIANIWMEARGESMEGKIAVAKVMRNRMRMRYRSNGTISDTVLRPYQFSGWNTTDHNRLLAAALDDDDPGVRECEEAWQRSATEDAGIGDAAVMYYNPKGVREVPAWATDDKFLVQVGAHLFFRG